MLSVDFRFIAGACVAMLSGLLQSGAAASEARCTNGDFLQTCPASCAAACEDTSLYGKHPGLCEAAFAATKADPASCSSPEGIKPVNPVAACVARAKRLISEPDELIKNSQPRLEFYNAFFDATPDCAASIIGLTEMYECLDGEAEDVTTQNAELPAVEVNPSDTKSVERAVCSISNLVEIDAKASALRGRAELLDQLLGEASACRQKYQVWIESRESFCSDSKFPLCQATANFYAAGIKEQLSVAQTRNNDIVAAIKNLDKSLDLITFLGMAKPLVRCEAD